VRQRETIGKKQYTRTSDSLSVDCIVWFMSSAVCIASYSSLSLSLSPSLSLFVFIYWYILICVNIKWPCDLMNHDPEWHYITLSTVDLYCLLCLPSTITGVLRVPRSSRMDWAELCLNSLACFDTIIQYTDESYLTHNQCLSYSPWHRGKSRCWGVNRQRSLGSLQRGRVGEPAANGFWWVLEAFILNAIWRK